MEQEKKRKEILADGVDIVNHDIEAKQAFNNY